MRKYGIIAFSALASLAAAPALSAACCHNVSTFKGGNSVTVSQESGVTVYRAKPLISPQRLQSLATQQAQASRAKAQAEQMRKQARIEAEQRAQLNARLTAIEARQDTLIALQSQNRSMANRYYGPQFLRPNRIFFGDYKVWQGPQFTAAPRGSRSAPPLGF